MMKPALNVSALAISLLMAGCSDAPGPLASGKAVSGMIWKNPTSAPSNEGNGIPKDAQVDVYDRLIIVHLHDGTRQVAPLDHVSGLLLK